MGKKIIKSFNVARLIKMFVFSCAHVVQLGEEKPLLIYTTAVATEFLFLNG